MKKINKKVYNILIYPNKFNIIKLSLNTTIPKWIFKCSFYSITKTEEELSIVCDQGTTPQKYRSDANWKLLKIDEQLELNLVGVIKPIVDILAKAKISIFIISTYNTDYFLIKENKLSKTTEILTKNGYQII